MSRWAQDPEAAADALILRGLDDIAVAGHVLSASQSQALPNAVRRRGAECIAWSRRLVEGATAAPWPPAGPFDLAFVRLPKARDEQVMTAQAVLSVLRPTGRLVLYGGNDEGIRSAAGMLEEITGEVTTLAIRGHGRVLAAHRPEAASALRSTLTAWRTASRLDIAGRPHDWVTYPGCFAAGRVDEGTALLIATLPPLAAGARVLDYGCGTGIIGAALQARRPNLQIHALDNDAVALAALGENVPAAKPILGTRVADVVGCRYDAMVSNPPLHLGIAEDHALLDRLIAEAPAHLVPRGLLQLVVPRRVPLDRLLGRQLGRIATVAVNGRYRVWRAQAAT